jgi:hypothetical protein
MHFNLSIPVLSRESNDSVLHGSAFGMHVVTFECLWVCRSELCTFKCMYVYSLSICLVLRGNNCALHENTIDMFTVHSMFRCTYACAVLTKKHLRSV